MLKPKPWWLKWSGKDTWISIYPHIYHPESTPPELFQGLFLHESEHLQRQKDLGRFRWLFRWLTSKSFRLDEEARGIAEEVKLLPYYRDAIIHAYAIDLAGSKYFHAAGSVEIAKRKIEQYL